MYGVFIAMTAGRIAESRQNTNAGYTPGTVKLLDLTWPTPAENLACDEALLDQAEATGGDEVLRFWESPAYFVVVGYSNHVATEVNVEACRAASIPILRRCTGGGTVVQGPGCLNYALILRQDRAAALATVTGTNKFIMERHRDAIAGCSGAPSADSERRPLLPSGSGTAGGSQNRRYTVDGHTDLAIGGRKFSGNAQRRKRRYLLFHGSFLYNFDLDLIAKLLPMPSRQPTYRQDRTHRDFLTNLPLAPVVIRKALTGLWNATGQAVQPETATLVREKYATADWTFKF
jgi:lipoate-protein ligase A